MDIEEIQSNRAVDLLTKNKKLKEEIARRQVERDYLENKIKLLKEALKPAKRAIISLHCNYENTRAPHDGKVSGCEVCNNLQLIEQALEAEK